MFIRPSVISAVILCAWIPRVEAQPTPTQQAQNVASLRIVNATSVPEISISINGQVAYPQFAQGMYTGNSEVADSTLEISVRDLKSNAETPPYKLKITPGIYQTLVITGNFSVTSSSEDRSVSAGQKKEPIPNVAFHLLNHEYTDGGGGLRFRFLNGIASDDVIVNSKGNSLLTVKPGQIGVLNNQPRPAKYVIDVAQQKIPLTLVQSANENQTVVFYLKDGKPLYVAFSEEGPNS